MVIDEEERRVNDGRGKTGAANVPHVPVVQVQPARVRKILVVKSSCLFQSLIMGRPKKPCAQWFISPATCAATLVNTGSRWMASLRLRWLSRDMVEI
jgi:hypothetical protein